MNKVLVTADTTTTTLIARSLSKLLAEKQMQVIDGDFNSWLLQVLSNHSIYQNDKPDIWIQIWSPRAVSDNPQIESQLDQFLSALNLSVQTNTHTKIVLTTFVVDPTTSQPLSESLRLTKLAMSLNQRLFDFSLSHKLVQIMDLQSFFTNYGLATITDSRFEAMGRMYFSPKGSELLASFLARGISCLITTPKKVLVLDLDNTLWGGVLGEDGIDGIKIGGEGSGHLFTRFQQAVLNLKQNGILLALCSKNNEADALKVFNEHPDMLIKLSDIAAYEINWEPKALNLKKIASDLNLGIDSLVFFDDSAFERENVRQLAPEVSVIEVPKAPSDYILALSQFWGFDTFKVTQEDKMRSVLYQQEAQRKSLKKSAIESGAGLIDFYQSLNMQASLKLADPSNLERTHQLIMKTNQFNLTTKRYSESELQTKMANPQFDIYHLRLQDKMGESGISGVVILEKKPDLWEIENLMLSCRIIGRTVEFALIRALCEKAHQLGVKTLIASFIKSEKNQVAQNFLADSHFTQIDQTKWSLKISDYQNLLPKDYVQVQFKL